MKRGDRRLHIFDDSSVKNDWAAKAPFVPGAIPHNTLELAVNLLREGRRPAMQMFDLGHKAPPLSRNVIVTFYCDVAL